MKTYKLSYIKKHRPSFAKNNDIWNHVLKTHVFKDKDNITINDLKSLAIHYQRAEEKYVRGFIIQLQKEQNKENTMKQAIKQVQKKDEARAQAHLTNVTNRYNALLDERKQAKTKGHNNKAKELTERIIKAKEKVQAHEEKYAKVKADYIAFMKSELKRLA